jgi:hypothetical protein
LQQNKQQCSQIVQMMPHQPFLHGKDMIICISSWHEPVKIQTLWVQQQQQQLLQKTWQAQTALKLKQRE